MPGLAQQRVPLGAVAALPGFRATGYGYGFPKRLKVTYSTTESPL